MRSTRNTLAPALALHDALYALALAAVWVLVPATPALAYVDPSVMTYTIQALAAVALALSAVLGVAFRRTRKALMRILHIDEGAGRVAEPAVSRIDPSSKPAADAACREALAAGGGAARGGSKHRAPGLPWRRRLVLALLVCIFDAFTVLIVAPYELVAANSSSLIFGLDSVWKLILVAGLLIGVVCGFILSAFRGRAFDVLLALAVAFGIGAYVQTLFLNNDLTVADGNLVDWTQYNTITAISALVWGGIAAALVTLTVKRGRAGRAVAAASSVVLVLVQLVGVVSLWVSPPDGSSVQSQRVYTTEQGMFDVSGKSNVIVLVVDTVDSLQTEAVYANHPEMLNEFTGFTWYQNSTGSMIPTRYGIPFLLTGSYPKAEESWDDFFDRFYSGSTFLDDVAAQGYTTGIYSDSFSPEYAKTRTINVHPLDASKALDKRGTLAILYQCSLYRDMPWVLKPFFWYYTDQINNAMLSSDADDDPSSTPCVMNDPAYYQKLKERGLSINSEDASFRFIHLVGTHTPYTMDAQGNLNEEGTSLEDQTLGTFRILSEYLRQLKELRVYDQSTIIVTADHGEWYLTEEPLTKPTSPIIFVKPAQDSGTDAAPCVISQEPASHKDLQATMLKGMGASQEVLDHYGEFNVALEDRHDPADRLRTYCMLTHDGKRDYDLIEYQIVGDVADFNNWHLDGNDWRNEEAWKERGAGE
ncbi:MAG: hypothetical protein LKI67_06065 [Olsenella sp.]|nr:hypothetical protein [Olsenella sp.]MCI1644758.1 hypothetical protein [Olsenella sp.]MCI1811407.1 hypothetical protein [Olsenella sp.]